MSRAISSRFKLPSQRFLKFDDYQRQSIDSRVLSSSLRTRDICLEGGRHPRRLSARLLRPVKAGAAEGAGVTEDWDRCPAR